MFERIPLASFFAPSGARTSARAGNVKSPSIFTRCFVLSHHSYLLKFIHI